MDGRRNGRARRSRSGDHQARSRAERIHAGQRRGSAGASEGDLQRQPRRRHNALAKYATADSGVASVDDDGKGKIQGSGETAITVWYQSRVAFARFATPDTRNIPH